MPDSPTPPPGSPTPTSHHRNDAVLNQAQVQALTKAEQIVAAARKATYAPALALRDITPAMVDQLDADILAARRASARAIHHTTGKEVATAEQLHAKRSLILSLQEVQAAARQKYSRREPVKLQAYFIGKRLDQSRADLLQYAAGILLQLEGDPTATPPVPADPLPGIIPAKITALAAARSAYDDAKNPQTHGQTDATDERSERDILIDDLTDRRMDIQFAADAEWPYSDDINAGARREFYLPLSQPYNG